MDYGNFSSWRRNESFAQSTYNFYEGGRLGARGGCQGRLGGRGVTKTYESCIVDN